MKKLLLISLFAIHCSLFTVNAQVLCVQCFDQNDSIGVNVGANNLIINGGFENTTCGFNSNNNTWCPNSANYNCNIANWTCTGGGVGTYSCFYDSTYWKVLEGVRSPYFGNNFCSACPLGDTACLINSECTTSGIPWGYPLVNPNFGDTSGLNLFQTVNGLIPGNTYVLEFWAGGECNGFDFQGKGLFAVDLGFGNILLRCRPTPPHTGIGTRFLIEFKATSTSHTIKFTNWGHISSNHTELILDDVRLYNPIYLPPFIAVCQEIGINEASLANVEVYPNPTTNELTIKTGNNEPSQIIIYDLLSRNVLQQTFTTETTLNTEALAKGVYMYEVRNKKGTTKGKIVKSL